MAKPKKINLKEEALAAGGAGDVEGYISDAMLLDLCPKTVLAKFKAAKSPAARADLLFQIDRKELKELRAAFKAMDDFVGKLEQWFVQEFRDSQTGVTGKLGRVEVKNKEVATADDWAVLYAYIKKNSAFDILNKAVNQKAVRERWEQGKEVPGVGKFIKKVISLTGVKEGK